MKKGINKQIMTGIIFMLFSVFYFINSFGFATRARYKGIGGDFMPKLYSVLLFFCATVQLITGLKTYFRTQNAATKTQTANTTGIKHNMKNMGLCFILILIYFLSMKIIGFIFSSIIFLFLLAHLLIPDYIQRNKKLYAGLIIFSILLPIISFWFFRNVIYTPLPIGIIFNK